MKKILPLLAALAAFALPGLSHAAADQRRHQRRRPVQRHGHARKRVGRGKSGQRPGSEFLDVLGQRRRHGVFIVTSDVLEFGMSLYQGVLDEFDLTVPGFESSGDFASLFFVAGTPDFGATGTELLNIAAADDRRLCTGDRGRRVRLREQLRLQPERRVRARAGAGRGVAVRLGVDGACGLPPPSRCLM